MAAAIAAAATCQQLICAAACGPEAAFALAIDVTASPDLVRLLDHRKGLRVLVRHSQNTFLLRVFTQM